MEGAPRIRFMEACKMAINGYNNYHGRSRRCELWFWALGLFLVSLILGIIAGIITAIFNTNIFMYIVNVILLFVFFLFSLPLAVRRLHDIGKSGWFILLGLIPIVGFIILLYFYCQDSQRETNEYGPSPKYSGSDPSAVNTPTENMI